MMLGSGTYVAQDEQLGLVAFGGVLTRSGSTVHVQTRDTVRKRIFIGPLRLQVSIDAGVISEFSYDQDSGTVSMVLSQSRGLRTEYVVVWPEPTSSSIWSVTSNSAGRVRGGWHVPLLPLGGTTVQLGQS